jgi:hypothetical protein
MSAVFEKKKFSQKILFHDVKIEIKNQIICLKQILKMRIDGYHFHFISFQLRIDSRKIHRVFNQI